MQGKLRDVLRKIGAESDRQCTAKRADHECQRNSAGKPYRETLSARRKDTCAGARLYWADSCLALARLYLPNDLDPIAQNACRRGRSALAAGLGGNSASLATSHHIELIGRFA